TDRYGDNTGSPALLPQARALAERFNVPYVTAQTVRAWAQDAGRTLFLCDVRTSAEFDAKSLPGAQHTPGGQLIQACDQHVAARGLCCSPATVCAHRWWPAGCARWATMPACSWTACPAAWHCRPNLLQRRPGWNGSRPRNWPAACRRARWPSWTCAPACNTAQDIYPVPGGRYGLGWRATFATRPARRSWWPTTRGSRNGRPSSWFARRCCLKAGWTPGRPSATP